MPVENKNMLWFLAQSMKSYGLEVITDRAIPDFRDGLKPVQRRILWSLWKNKILPNSKFKKSALVVGDVLGKYHPHSDKAVYDAMEILYRKSRYPLTTGSGNWGSKESSKAAMRYSEYKMSPYGLNVFDHIDVGTFTNNYDESIEEPLFFPSRMPILLMNGSIGVAVGVSTNIPPHNLKELCNAFIYLLQNPKAEFDKIVKFIKGPDYAYGGILTSSRKDVKSMYRNGKGTLHYRCEYHYEKGKKNNKLIITSYSPTFSPIKFMQRIQKLIDAKKIKNIIATSEGDIDKGDKLTVTFQSPELLKKYILPMLETHVSYQWYITERGEEKTSLRATALLNHMQFWIKYQKDIEKRKLKYLIDQINIELQKQIARLTAIQDIDAVTKCLKKKTIEDTRKAFKKVFKFNDTQIDYLLGITLGSLARANLNAQKDKISKLKSTLKDYKTDLRDIPNVILRNLKALKDYNPKVDRNIVSILRVTKIHDRRTLIDNEIPQLKLSNKNVGVLFTKKDGKLKEIGKTSSDDIKYAVNSYTFYTISNTGMGKRLTMSNYDSVPLDSVAGLVPADVGKLVIIDAEGNAVTWNTDKLQDTFKGMRTKSNITGMVGLKRGDKLLVLTESGKSKIIEYRELKAITRFQYGKKLIPKLRKGVKLYRIRKTDDWVKYDGTLLDISENNLDKEPWIVSETNLMKINGKWSVKNRRDIIKYIKGNRLEDIINL